MRDNIGNKIDRFPFDNIKKVSDLLYFEGPILSHYNCDGQDLLFYWIDFGESHNRWLIMNISEEQLVDFLLKQINLKSIASDNKFLFITDINADKKFENTYLINSVKALAEYLPEDDTYFNLTIPKIYLTLVEKRKTESLYIESLRNSALYFKLTPQEQKYGSTMSIDNVVAFLGRIKTSYLNYVDAKFRIDFSETYLNPERLNKAVETVKKQLFPRIVDLKWGSFGAGISSDYIMGDSSTEIKEWKKEIFTSYKNDVFNLNYASDEALEKVNAMFTEEQKENIFKPILSVLENKEYRVSVTNSELKVIKTLSPISEKTYNKLISPKVLKQQVEEIEKRLINIVVEIPVHGDIKSLKNKDLQQGIQFGEEVSNFTYKTSVIQGHGIKITLNKEIECEVNFNDGIYTIKDFILGITGSGDTRQTYINQFNNKFIGEYLRLKDTDNVLDEKDTEIYKVISGLIQKVESL